MSFVPINGISGIHSTGILIAPRSSNWRTVFHWIPSARLAPLDIKPFHSILNGAATNEQPRSETATSTLANPPLRRGFNLINGCSSPACRREFSKELAGTWKCFACTTVPFLSTRAWFSYALCRKYHFDFYIKTHVFWNACCFLFFHARYRFFCCFACFAFRKQWRKWRSEKERGGEKGGRVGAWGMG